MLKPEEEAPDFDAMAYHKGQFKRIKLSDYRGRWVVLFFWPMDFTFVCPTEIKEFNAHYDEFKDQNAEIIGGSVDNVYVHKAWAKEELGDIQYPLFSDTKREIGEAYGILDKENGVALRATFIIDPDGIIQWVNVSNLSVGRSVKETLRALKALRTGELCPVDWNEGMPTIKPTEL